MILDTINNPSDLKNLDVKALNILSGEIRKVLLNKLSNKGGHVGPNLGMVEATIALHYVFNSPIDKFVFDVSHQSYIHKMLTGRKDAFIYPEKYNKVSGYTNPKESEHDMFNIGHTSTSISLALGLVKARDLKEEKSNIIAIIGDGSLSGGEALEGLDYAGEIKSNFIIVVNDNDMSIAENHGGLYKNLKQLRESKGLCENNLFKAMGLEYMYVDKGNDIKCLIEAFERVKDINVPIVVHIKTKKGKGYKPAEENKEEWHWNVPFNLETGETKLSFEPDLGSLSADYFLDKMKKDNTVVVLTAGVPANIGFTKEKRELAGEQFVDVGIAEETAVAMASGIAKNGGKPVFATYSSFIQRTYDQLSQDLCINNNPATILINGASVYGVSDVTHLGIFDIPLISNIPNIVYLAPTSKEEYFAMLDWSIEQDKYPVAIRIPVNVSKDKDNRDIEKDYSNINKYKVDVKGEKVAILALGDFYSIGCDIIKAVKEELGFTPTLINPRYITGLDKNMLEELKMEHDLIITLEDGILSGGFGEKIASYYGKDKMKVINYGLKKEFLDRYDVNEVLEENGITIENILLTIKQQLK